MNEGERVALIWAETYSECVKALDSAMTAISNDPEKDAPHLIEGAKNLISQLVIMRSFGIRVNQRIAELENER